MNKKEKSAARSLLVTVVIIFLVIYGYLALTKEPNLPSPTSTNETQKQAPASTVQVQAKSETKTPTVVTPSVTVTNPNGGELIGQNTTSSISWSFAGLIDGDSVTIGVRTSDEKVCWIGKSLVSRRTFSFVPNQVKCDGSTINLKSGGKFKAQVVVDKYASGKGVSDVSDAEFTISTR